VDCIIVITVDNEEIKTTPEHPFYVKGFGWQQAGKLVVGAKLMDVDGVPIEISKIEKVDGRTTVYNLEVSELHTYYVSDKRILVHNECGGRQGVWRKKGKDRVRIDFPLEQGGHGHDFHMHYGDDSAIFANGELRHGSEMPTAKQWQMFLDYLQENMY
jgi:hypothetical protein